MAARYEPPGSSLCDPLAVIPGRHVDADELLLRITQCPIVASCRAGEPHPCSSIVGVQESVPDRNFNVPEPWSGDIGQARILFVSSNPSIGDRFDDPHDQEVYPTPSWNSARRIDFFRHRFGGGERPWTNERRTLMEDGSHWRTPVRFWSSVNARAQELLPGAVMGEDVALTEVVHCKSSGEIGVKDAVATCTDMWLDPVLSVAGARVIVALGDTARGALERRFGLIAEGTIKEIGRSRVIVRLPHPSRIGPPKSFSSHYEGEQIEHLRAILKEPAR